MAATKKTIEQEPFGAYLCDAQTIKVMKPITKELGWDMSSIHNGGIANAVRSLSITAAPKFLVVDLAESDDMLADLNALAEVCNPGTVVLAIGVINDVSIYRELLNSGMHDYLVKPIAPSLLREAMISADDSINLPGTKGAPSIHAVNKQICVIGARGGVGSTTIASNIALLLSQQKKNTIAFLDLDIHFGTGAMQFDLEPGRGLFDAMDNPARIDGLFIERAMVKASDSLFILGSEASLNTGIVPDPAAISLLMTTLLTSFDSLVVDVSRHALTTNPNVFEDATDVVVVSDLTLASTRDTIRILAHLKLTAPEARVHMVINRAQVNGQNEVDPRDFIASVEHNIDITIPDDQKVMMEVGRTGKPLLDVAKASKPAQAIEKLVGIILGDDAIGTKKKSSLLSKLMPRKRKKKNKGD